MEPTTKEQKKIISDSVIGAFHCDRQRVQWYVDAPGCHCCHNSVTHKDARHYTAVPSGQAGALRNKHAFAKLCLRGAENPPFGAWWG